ncbi:MAG: hypothetical protein M1840_004445 [Geoglossum simile]|nr:MAG: hypothetical protein M1840_004445 [Geoglossum simile]
MLVLQNGGVTDFFVLWPGICSLCSRISDLAEHAAGTLRPVTCCIMRILTEEAGIRWNSLGEDVGLGVLNCPRSAVFDHSASAPSFNLANLHRWRSGPGTVGHRSSEQGFAPVGLNFHSLPLNPQSDAGPSLPHRPRGCDCRSAGRLCDHCKICGMRGSLCSQCDEIFCDTCWGGYDPHKGYTSANHEKTDIRVNDVVRRSLKVFMTSQEQMELHQQDENTTWFGVVGEGMEQLVLHDYGRFGDLIAEFREGRHRKRYPRLVSFVGETGAGKSSLIKLLVELVGLHYSCNVRHQTPVVGPRNESRPTSGDVHLYADPHSFGDQYPILYADSEGLEGGEMLPVSATGSERTPRRDRRAHHGSTRRITWDVPNPRERRQYVVKNLYPRVFYTFSDVVVFVLDNPRQFEKVAGQLLEWAEIALEKSSNQPALPHAIIVLNASDINQPDEEWGAEAAKQRLFSAYREILRSRTLEPYVNFWQGRGKKLDTLEELFRMYYSSISVIRVPRPDRPALVYRQVMELYEEICRACQESWKKKQSLRMLSSAEEFHQYLQSAFDHFANNLRDPFDFVQSSVVNRPIPPDFGGNVLKLAINAMKVNSRRMVLSADNIFYELSFIVPSCIMLDEERQSRCGPTDKIFSNYKEHCDEMLERFCTSQWPCEFSNGRDHCVNVSTGHTKGHQSRDGYIFASGHYESKALTPDFRSTFLNNIYNNLQQLQKELTRGANDPKKQTPATIHQKNILRPFYSHIGGSHRYISHSVCFSCLMRPPEHPLPCDHVLCTPCVQAYGNPQGKHLIVVKECPLEVDCRFHKACHIMLKPTSAGIRVLTLDGGGIRAVAGLQVLRKLQEKLGGEIPLTEFFDLIIGTDTGGLIALGLAIKNWRVSKLLCSEFIAFLGDIFERRSWWDEAYRLMWQNFRPSKYKTRPFERALRGLYSEDDLLFGWKHRNNSSTDTPTKIAVISTLVTGTPTVISNYNRHCPEESEQSITITLSYPDQSSHLTDATTVRLELLPYHFQRPDRQREELKVWQAARATATIPTIFKSYRHSSSNETYRGSSFTHNNPIEIAHTESKYIWPDISHRLPDVTLSVGMGSSSMTNRRLGRTPPQTRLPFIGREVDTSDLEQSSFKCEQAWRDYLSKLRLKSPDDERYVRLNPELDYPVPRWDEVERMRGLPWEVISRWDDLPIGRLAQRLIATCFYFETTKDEVCDGGIIYTGSIQCRFTGKNLRYLGEHLYRTLKGYGYFAVRAQEAKEYYIDNRIISDMTNPQPRFGVGPIKVKVSKKVDIVKILMHFGRDEVFPISGFPRSMQADSEGSQYVAPGRRPADDIPLQDDWTPPTSEPRDTLSSYMGTNYVAGVIGAQFASRSGGDGAELIYSPDFARAELADGQVTRGRAEPMGEIDFGGAARVGSNSVNRPQAGMEGAQRPLPYRSASSAANPSSQRHDSRQSAHRDAVPRNQVTSSRRSNQRSDIAPCRRSSAPGQGDVGTDYERYRSELEELRADPIRSQRRTDRRTSRGPTPHRVASDHTQGQPRMPR